LPRPPVAAARLSFFENRVVFLAILGRRIANARSALLNRAIDVRKRAIFGAQTRDKSMRKRAIL
jgi:hypothetical protein